MVNHVGLNQTNQFWSPPGGGMQFGEPAAETLQREFREETGLEVQVLDFLCINEYIGPSLQAIELFFLVRSDANMPLHTGSDPELKHQIIKEVKFMTIEELKQYTPQEVHSLITHCKTMDDLYHLQGRFFTNHTPPHIGNV
jgi:ADP-ribose pyrophosphatase YjhB (NUDIX family)